MGTVSLPSTSGMLYRQYDTPSVSPFGLPAPPEVEPRALRAVLKFLN